jgi:hypothetical protein
VSIASGKDKDRRLPALVAVFVQRKSAVRSKFLTAGFILLVLQQTQRSFRRRRHRAKRHQQLMSRSRSSN